MDKYITKLLKTANRIIIPELGAFIVKKDEPGTILFNEFLKFNDGVFVGYVAEQESIEKEEALEKTENFVKQIFLQLEKGESHVIENLGAFQKDEKGKIQFIPIAAVKEEELEEKKEEEKAEKKKKKAEEKESVKLAAGMPEESKELIELEEKEKEPVAEEEETEELPEKEEEIEKVEEKPPEKVEEEEPSFIYEEKKKSKGYLWLLLLLIPVALFLIWFFFLRDGKPVEQAVQPVPAETEEAITTQPEAVAEEGEETAITGEEGAVEEVAETAEPQQPEAIPEKPEVDEEVTQPVVSGEKRFYIVAGCFEIEENADKYVRLLRDKGYDSEKFGMIGRLHAVSVYSNPSRSEAIRKLHEIRETVEPNAWLLYY